MFCANVRLIGGRVQVAQVIWTPVLGRSRVEPRVRRNGPSDHLPTKGAQNFSDPAMNETYEILISSITLSCVHEAFEVTSEISPDGRQRTRFDLFTSRNAALPPAQILLTRPKRPMNGDADILNGMESKMDSSHATARPSRMPAYCLEGSSRAMKPWTSCAFLVPLSYGRMGPGNSAECAGVRATRCKVVSSMEHEEMKTESRGNRIRGCGAGGRARAAEHADLCHRSGGGLRDSSGRPCMWGKRVSRVTASGARYSG